MKRLITTLCFLLLAGVVAADAQIYRGKSSIRTVERGNSSKYPRYQGEINAGYGFGNDTLTRVTFETVNGVRFNRYLYAGLGVGVAYFHKISYETDKDHLLMPVTVSMRGYYPVTKRFEPYAALDLGYSCDLCKSWYHESGVYIAYGIGFSYGKLNFAVGFQRLIFNSVEIDEYLGRHRKHTLQIKAGVKF